MGILSTSGLSRNFGGIHALDKLDITIEKGQIHGLIGPNGSGKTTLFNLITGLLPVSEGNIYFDSVDITCLSPYIINKLGVSRTFQKALIMPLMTCLENVMLGMHGHTKLDLLGTFLRPPFTHSKQETRITQRAIELLQFVGIADLAEKRAAELVWVECQLMQIARALACEPKLLLLDEPTGGMGSAEKEKVDRLIREIRDKMGMTIILVAHDVDLVMGISDIVTVINFGKKIAEGTPKQVRNDPVVLEAYIGR
jgi:branched-chain amino acid transport system ATP-binding protein